MRGSLFNYLKRIISDTPATRWVFSRTITDLLNIINKTSQSNVVKPHLKKKGWKQIRHNKKIINHYYIIHHFIWEKDIPLLGSGGMSFVGNEDSMEANEAQYHAHL